MPDSPPLRAALPCATLPLLGPRPRRASAGLSGWGTQPSVLLCLCSCPCSLGSRHRTPSDSWRLRWVGGWVYEQTPAEGHSAAGAAALGACPLPDAAPNPHTAAVQAGCSAHLAAAAAAAACAAEDPAAAAQAAFDAAFAAAKEAALKQKSGGSETGGGGAAGTKPAGAGGAGASVLRQRGGQQGGGALGGAGQAAAAGDEAAGRVIEEEERRQAAGEDANVPEWMRGEFSWRVSRMAGPGLCVGPVRFA